jgi:hypothetical protein
MEWLDTEANRPAARVHSQNKKKSLAIQWNLGGIAGSTAPARPDL